MTERVLSPDEIDLRPYVEAILVRWKWVGAIAFIAAIIAFSLTSLLPINYEATALVAVTNPRYSLQFDTRFRTLEEEPIDSSAYPELALSDDLMLSLFDALETVPTSVDDPLELRDFLEVQTGNDPSLLRLIVTLEDANLAADVANKWAQLFAQSVNEVYGGQGSESLAFLEEQQQAAEVRLEQIDADLVEFQARNMAPFATTQLRVYSETHAIYLADLRTVSDAIQDATLLREIQENSALDSVTFADQLAALSLQAQTLGSVGTIPLNVQFGESSELTGSTPQEQIAYLDQLIGSLTAKKTQIEVQLAELEPTILETQQSLQAAQVEQSRLKNERELAESTYLTLATKVEEARIASQDSEGLVKVASRAAVPQEAEGRGRVRNAAVAALLGIVVGLIFILIKQWWLDAGRSETQVAA